MNMSHNSSSSTSSTEGAAFPWILEHLLAYPSTYEIPLRTMYTLNSAPQAAKQPRQSVQLGTPSLSSSASSTDCSPASPSFPSDQQHQPIVSNATEHFKSCLMTHISRLPSQPFSLPPAFITSFVRRCFTEELSLVDFTQALTALDYLKDLENRRKREFSLVLQRLGLDPRLLEQTRREISRNGKISEWVENMQEKERKVEQLYTQVYIGIRRWVIMTSIASAGSYIVLTRLPDSNKRNASDTLQQSKQYCYAKHPLSTNNCPTSNSSINTSNPGVAAQRIFPIHSRCPAKWQGYSQKS